MTLNLNVNLREQIDALDPLKWTPLQAEVCMNIANAKLFAFEFEAERLAEFERLRLISRPEAADILHVAAVYNQLIYEYGADHVQKIMMAAFQEAA